MTKIAYNFDFDNNGSNVPGQHEERRERQNALAPVIFNEYENLLVEIIDAIGDPVFTDYPGINKSDIGSALRETYDVMYQRSENLSNYKFDKAGGTITGDVTVTTDHKITAPIFESVITTASGLSPFTVASTVRVENLNSDLLDGRHAGTLTGYIPINGAGLCAELDSDLWDGQHSSSALLFKNASNSTSAFRIQNAAGDTIFNIDSTNKRLGVNTSTPKEALDVSGGARFTGSKSGADSTPGIYIQHSGTIGYIESMNPTVAYLPVYMRGSEYRFQIGDTTKVMIANSGDVYIGKETGSYKLDVEGQIRATTGLKLGSSGEATVAYNSSEGSIDFTIG